MDRQRSLRTDNTSTRRPRILSCDGVRVKNFLEARRSFLPSRCALGDLRSQFVTRPKRVATGNWRPALKNILKEAQTFADGMLISHSCPFRAPTKHENKLEPNYDR